MRVSHTSCVPHMLPCHCLHLHTRSLASCPFRLHASARLAAHTPHRPITPLSAPGVLVTMLGPSRAPSQARPRVGYLFGLSPVPAPPRPPRTGRRHVAARPVAAATDQLAPAGGAVATASTSAATPKAAEVVTVHFRQEGASTTAKPGEDFMEASSPVAACLPHALDVRLTAVCVRWVGGCLRGAGKGGGGGHVQQGSRRAVHSCFVSSRPNTHVPSARHTHGRVVHA